MKRTKTLRGFTRIAMHIVIAIISILTADGHVKYLLPSQVSAGRDNGCNTCAQNGSA